MFSREYIEEEAECTAAARTDRLAKTTAQIVVPIVNSRLGCPFTPRGNRALFLSIVHKNRKDGHARARERRMEILEERERADLDISLFAPSHLRAAPYIGIRSS